MRHQVTIDVKNNEDEYEFKIKPWKVVLDEGDDIEWVCKENGQDITSKVKIVLFSAGPFGTSFVQPEGNSLVSPAITENAAAGYVYRYRVRLLDGEPSPYPFVIDPEYERRDL